MAARALLALVAGAVFGFGMALSGMTNPARVLGFFDLAAIPAGAWDPTLAFVMGGALVPMAVAWRIRARMTRSVLGAELPGPPSRVIDAKLVGGSALFGLGWGFFDCNNMPILSQIVRPDLRATGYGVMNLVSISVGGLADWGFGALRTSRVPLNVSFALFAAPVGGWFYDEYRTYAPALMIAGGVAFLCFAGFYAAYRDHGRPAGKGLS